MHKPARLMFILKLVPLAGFAAYVSAWAAAVIEVQSGQVMLPAGAGEPALTTSQWFEGGTSNKAVKDTKAIQRIYDGHVFFPNRNTAFDASNCRYQSENPKADCSIFEFLTVAPLVMLSAICKRNADTLATKTQAAAVGVHGQLYGSGR